MNVYKRIREKIKEQRDMKAQYRKAYQEEYKKARLSAEKQKARVNAQRIVTEAKKDAAAGGRLKRVISEFSQEVKSKNRKKKLKKAIKKTTSQAGQATTKQRDFTKSNLPPMFR